MWTIATPCPVLSVSNPKAPSVGSYDLITKQTNLVELHGSKDPASVCVNTNSFKQYILSIDATQGNLTTYYSVLLSKCKTLAEGKYIHSLINESSYGLHTFLSNCLIQMYGELGSPHDARLVFDQTENPNTFSWNLMFQAYASNGYVDDAILIFHYMPKRNVVSWTAMITLCANHEAHEEALSLYHEMNLKGFKPNRVTFITVLNVCLRLGDLVQGQCVHADIVDCGCLSDVSIGNMLISMYDKCDDHESAKNTFQSMPEYDVVSWNAFIAATLHNDSRFNWSELLDEMLRKGYIPNNVTCICLLDGCSKDDGQSVHNYILYSGMQLDMALENSLLNLYSKSETLSDIDYMFEQMHLHDVVSWNILISAYAQCKEYSDALDLFDQMQLEGFTPDDATLVSVMEACGNLEIKKCQNVHAKAIDVGLHLDTTVGNAIVSMYGKCSAVDDAKIAFNRLVNKTTISWNTMSTVYQQNKCAMEALEVLHQMECEGMLSDAVSCICGLQACLVLGKLINGMEIHQYIVKVGYELDIDMGTALVRMYVKCNSLEDATAMVFQMPVRNATSWNSIISASVQNNKRVKALELYSQMQDEGFKPNTWTFICILDACAELADAAKCEIIHSEIKKCFEIDNLLGSAIIQMYGRCGNISKAKDVFDSIQERTTRVWNSIIVAYSYNGYGQQALNMYKRMLSHGSKPDQRTFVAVLCACNHAGLVDEGKYHFSSIMDKYLLVLTKRHYWCMIDILARTGQMDEAECLIQTMPFEYIASSWSRLLGACRVHQDKQLTERIAKRIFEFQPKNTAPYVLLSNIYATVDMWECFDEYEEALMSDTD